MGSLFGGGGSAPDPFSPQAVEFRKWEREEATKSARAEHEWQRAQALEERIRLIRAEQQQANETVESINEDFGQDADQSFSNMWSSLNSGVSNARSGAQSSGTSTGLGNAFTQFLTGDS